MRQRRDGTGLYVLASAVFASADADRMRESLRTLTDDKHRFHWRDEKPASRREAVSLVGQLDALHFTVVGTGLDNPRQERGRRQCLRRMLWELDQAGVTRVWLDARRPSQNRLDIELVDVLRVQRVLSAGLRVEFAYPSEEPLAWLADIVAGAVSAALGDGDDEYLNHLRGVLGEPILIQLT